MIALLYTLYALQLTIVQPFTGTVFRSGDIITVAWTVDGEVPATVPFALLDGRNDMNNADNLGQIASVSPSTLSFNYKIPDSVTSGKGYFIRVGDNGDYRYSPAFSVEATATTTKPAATSTDTSSADSATTTLGTPVQQAAVGTPSSGNSIIFSYTVAILLALLQ